MIRSSSSENAENSLTMDTIQYNKMIPYCKPEIVSQKLQLSFKPVVLVRLWAIQLWFNQSHMPHRFSSY